MTEKKEKMPIGFYMCSLTFSFERAAYYASKWLLYVYLTAAIVKGGLAIDNGQAAMMQSNLVAFTYIAPIVGGIIADRLFGARYLIPLGLLIMAVGYYIGGSVESLGGMWALIILVSIGTGFFKTNLSAVTGNLFKDEATKNKAFSTQYSFVNVGSFVGTTLVGILYVTLGSNGKYGFLACFKLAALICVIGAIWFIFAWRFLGNVGKRPFKEDVDEQEVASKVRKPLKPFEKRRVKAIILISFFSIIFWIFWYLTYLSVYDYAPKYVNLTMSSGFKIPTAWFDSANAFWCVLMGPVLGIIWLKLSKRPQGDISIFKKLALGLFFLGVSFLMLVGAEVQRGIGASEAHKASIIWIILFAFLLTLGEMVFSPLGNAFISRYSPKKIVSTMMAVWTVATFISAKSYGAIYNWILKFDFLKTYIAIAAILIILAAVLLVFEKPMASLVKLREGEIE